jgi:hypothetical protein
MSMNLLSGFQLEQPHVLVGWGISEHQLLNIFTGMELRRVTDGYFVTHCESLGGLSHMLGFHFTPRVDGALLEFELFGTEYPDLETSYRVFQHHLEMTFGPATTTSAGTEGLIRMCGCFLEQEWCTACRNISDQPNTSGSREATTIPEGSGWWATTHYAVPPPLGSAFAAMEAQAQPNP